MNLRYHTFLVDVTKQSPRVSRLSFRQAPTGSLMPALPSPQGKKVPGEATAFPHPEVRGLGRAGSVALLEGPPGRPSRRAARSAGRWRAPAVRCG